ncbi:MAG: DUF3795 domain-containing protein [Candidatus Marinimicrobia bacterium]|nr:DUF3795 domain-containing protein [Candidatus Neomarinimicrobiota bacterium]
MNYKTLPPCGYTCHDCHFYGKGCFGCQKTCGKPFWIADEKWDACPIFDCCVNEKVLEHCGLCPELPCETFLTLRDPDMTDEAFEKSLADRKALLLSRVKNN